MSRIRLEQPSEINSQLLETFSYNYALSVYTDPFVFSSGFVVTTGSLSCGIVR
jgi:hypothetical protein